MRGIATPCYRKRLWEGNNGFTLIELIMVMVVLSVLAVSTIGLFAGQGEFAGRLQRDQLLAHLRLAQQVALARHDVNAPTTTWTLSRSGGTLQAQIVQGAYSTVRSLEEAGTTVTWSSATTTSCGAATGTLPLTLTFDQLGDLASETLICVSGNGQTWPVCVSAAGYAYAGVCTP